jgi:hypothetical protein
MRRWGWRVAIAATLVVPVIVQVAVQARSELVAADEAAANGDESAEVIHLGRALRWRMPLSPVDEHAIDRLLAIGEAAENDPADFAHVRALAAYREIRSALLGSRALDVPHADVVADVDARIARLMAAQSRELGVVAADEARQLERLREVPETSRTGPVLAAFALAAWVVATLTFLSRGLDARGRIVRPTGTRTGLLALAALVLWLVAWRFA